MFLKGRINENLKPLVEDVFLLSKDGQIPVKTVLDTGFNGMFCLPRELAELCELTTLGVETFELADGTLVEEELYIGKIILNGKPYLVELTLTDLDQALMGMQMLIDKIAVFDLKRMQVEVWE